MRSFLIGSSFLYITMICSRPPVRGGHLSTLRLLMEWKDHPPRADCREVEALVQAAEEDKLPAVRMLLKWTDSAPKVNIRDWG